MISLPPIDMEPDVSGVCLDHFPFKGTMSLLWMKFISLYHSETLVSDSLPQRNYHPTL